MIVLKPGTLFENRYEIDRRLGAGGMGAVYLAHDPSDPKFRVAIKVLYPGAIQSNQALERFRNEITGLHRIQHPNVVRAYEYFDTEAMQAYAMEYVDGGDPLERARSGPISSAEAATILMRLASALEAIHAAGIVHRDFKPENVLLTRLGVVKISDFGVARLRGAQTLTQAGNMVGTPKYLAPEYVETGECDARGDLFALGVIGYELIAGVSPWGPDFQTSQVLDRVKMPIPPLDQVAANCPPELARIIEKAMRIQLVRRYQSAKALLSDLEAFEVGEPVTAMVEAESEFTPVASSAKRTQPEPPTTTNLPSEGVPLDTSRGSPIAWALSGFFTAAILAVLGVSYFLAVRPSQVPAPQAVSTAHSVQTSITTEEDLARALLRLSEQDR